MFLTDFLYYSVKRKLSKFNLLNAELNFICHLLALLLAHHSLHVSRIRVKHATPGTTHIEYIIVEVVRARLRWCRMNFRAC
jgi:hypothetical protein